MWKGAQSAYARMCIEQASEEAIFAVTQEFGISREALEEGDRYANLQEYWEVMAKSRITIPPCAWRRGPSASLPKMNGWWGRRWPASVMESCRISSRKALRSCIPSVILGMKRRWSLGHISTPMASPRRWNIFLGFQIACPKKKLLRQLVLAHTADFGTARDF